MRFPNPPKEKGTAAMDPMDVPAMEIPDKTWYKDPGLRKLYVMMPILFLGATNNGYYGSLLNGLQTMPS